MVSELADLAAKSAQVYPVLLQTGVTYWATWAEEGLNYYGTLAKQWALAVQEPERRAEHVQGMLDSYKEHLVAVAQLAGQAVLKSNQKFEELLREPMPDADPLLPAEQALGQRVVSTLGDLARKVHEAGYRIKADELSDEELRKSLAGLKDAETRARDARQQVQQAVEGALRKARDLRSRMDKAEEKPSRSVRGVVADLERIEALVARKRKPGD